MPGAPLTPACPSSSSQNSFDLHLAAPAQPRAPSVPWKVRALNMFNHTQMQSESLSQAPC